MMQSKPRFLLRSGAYKLRSYRWLAWLGGSLVLLLFLGVGVAWALGYFSQDPRLAEIHELTNEVTANSRPPFDPKNRDLFGQIGEKMKELPQNLRDQAAKDMRDAMGQSMQQDMKRFFALTLDEQNAELDKRIKDMQAMMKQRENGKGGNGPPGGPPGGGPAASNGDPPKGGPGGGWRSLSPTDRLAARQSMIDKSTPEGRAQFHLFFQMMQQRAKQLGVTMPFGPR